MFLDDKPHEQFLHILFQDRNKSYGAFYLRRTYSRRVLTGLVITVITMVILLLLPYIVDALKPKPKLDASAKYITVSADDFPIPPGQMESMPEIEIPEETVPEIVTDSVPERKDPPRVPPRDDPKDADTSGKGKKPPGSGGDNGGPFGKGVNSNAVVPGGKGGDREQMKRDWLAYVQAHLVYPADEKRRGIKGKVLVDVHIAADGSVVNAKITKTLSPACDKEALRLVNEMPKWTPAILNGWPVVQPLQLSVDFGTSPK